MNNQQEVFKLDGLLEADLEEAKISKEDLLAIYFDYVSSLEMFKQQASYLGNILQLGKQINSVKWRVKDPLHLLKKIVRKRKEALNKNEQSSKYLSITVDNYKEIITDLIGLRAIYLFKAQWYEVNDFILSMFKVCDNEKITIYYAKDDDLSKLPIKNEIIFKEKNYLIDKVKKDSSYRSTHYMIESIHPHNFKIELQTRSILEEAWGEIDHHIRYPDFEDNLELQRRMSILNGALASCEQLTSNDFDLFIDLSKTELSLEDQSLNDNDENTTQSTDNVSESVKNNRIHLSVGKKSSSEWDKAIANIENARKQTRHLESILTSDNISTALSKSRILIDTVNKSLIPKDFINLETISAIENLQANEFSKLAKNTALNQLMAKKLSTDSPLNQAINKMNSPVLESLKRSSTLNLGDSLITPQIVNIDKKKN